MKVPLEITYRGVDKTHAIETLVYEKLAKLEQVCNHISSCYIAIKKSHDRPMVAHLIEFASTSLYHPVMI